jgi:hypothetical protein
MRRCSALCIAFLPRTSQFCVLFLSSPIESDGLPVFHRLLSQSYFWSSMWDLCKHVGPVVKHVGPVVKHVGPVVKHVGPVLEHVGPVLEHVRPVLEQVGQVVKQVGQVFEHVGHVVRA